MPQERQTWLLSPVSNVCVVTPVSNVWTPAGRNPRRAEFVTHPSPARRLKSHIRSSGGVSFGIGREITTGVAPDRAESKEEYRL